MNYNKSPEIIKEINKSNNILLTCHRNPDPDSIGSVLAMKAVLEKMGKSVDVICPSAKITKQVDYLRDYLDIKTGIDYANFPFEIYDLLIALDVPNISQFIGDEGAKQPTINTIVIDHHFVSTLNGNIRLVDNKATSVGEMLYSIFEDWVVDLDKNIAECLLTSIIGDTGAFSYPNVTSQTLRIAANLIDFGVDKDEIVIRIYRSEDFGILKFWNEVLSAMKIDKDGRYIYSFVPYSIYSKYENLDNVKSKAAGLFAPIIKNTDFGFVGVEEKENHMTVSFRGRTDFNTSEIAKALGGGGHKAASSAKIKDVPFEEAKEKVLSVVRKYAKKD